MSSSHPRVDVLVSLLEEQANCAACGTLGTDAWIRTHDSDFREIRRICQSLGLHAPLPERVETEPSDLFGWRLPELVPMPAVRPMADPEYRDFVIEDAVHHPDSILNVIGACIYRESIAFLKEYAELLESSPPVSSKGDGTGRLYGAAQCLSTLDSDAQYDFVPLQRQYVRALIRLYQRQVAYLRDHWICADDWKWVFERDFRLIRIYSAWLNLDPQIPECHPMEDGIWWRVQESAPRRGIRGQQMRDTHSCLVNVDSVNGEEKASRLAREMLTETITFLEDEVVSGKLRAVGPDFMSMSYFGLTDRVDPSRWSDWRAGRSSDSAVRTSRDGVFLLFNVRDVLAAVGLPDSRRIHLDKEWLKKIELGLSPWEESDYHDALDDQE